MPVLTIDDLKQTLHKIDLINRPNILFIHPDDAETLKTAWPDAEKEIVIQPTMVLEKGKCICMRREDLEHWGCLEAEALPDHPYWGNSHEL